MELKSIEYKLTVCKVADISEIEWMADFYFVGKTDFVGRMNREKSGKAKRESYTSWYL